MGNVVTKGTHYMVFPHQLTGRTRSDLSVRIFKNGIYLQDIAYEVLENPDYCYIITFKNDGTDKSLWTCIVSDPSVSDTFYVESWEVTSNNIEANIQQIRSRGDSNGGVFGKSIRGG